MFIFLHYLQVTISTPDVMWNLDKNTKALQTIKTPIWVLWLTGQQGYNEKNKKQKKRTGSVISNDKNVGNINNLEIKEPVFFSLPFNLLTKYDRKKTDLALDTGN